MEYRKKMQKRLYYAYAYLLLGAALNIAAFFTHSNNYFLSSFGSAMLIIGIVRIIRHKRLVSSDKAVKQQEIAETDERNIMLAEKARSWAFAAYIILTGIVLIVLAILGIQDTLVQMISYSICLLVILYWICYHILKRKY